MSDEEVIEEELDDSTEDDGDPFAPEEPAGDDSARGRGPGFIRGVIFGLIAGAGVSQLLGPGAGKQLRDSIGEQTTPVRGYGEGGASDEPSSADAPANTLLALVASLRERIREARRQASIASREAEELTHARFAELTRQSDA